MKFRVSIAIFVGNFPSQQTAFAHLLDACPDADLDQVEVLTRPFSRRLLHYFAPEDLNHPPIGEVTTMVLALPGSRVPPASTDRLRLLGRFPGTVTRALLPEE